MSVKARCSNYSTLLNNIIYLNEYDILNNCVDNDLGYSISDKNYWYFISRKNKYMILKENYKSDVYNISADKIKDDIKELQIKKSKKKEKRIKQSEYYRKQNYKLRFDPIPLYNYYKGNYFRHPKSHSIRLAANDCLYNDEFGRVKERKYNTPYAKVKNIDKSWKSNNKKHKQWEKHIDKHYDRITSVKNTYDIMDIDENELRLEFESRKTV